MAARFEFDFEWRITLFTLLLLPLLVSLGFWQLQRADEKALLAAAFEQQQARAPAPLDEVTAYPVEQLAYLPVLLKGQYRQGEHFLLDNRMFGRKFGNEVLSVFELDSGGMVLVNRGWIEADSSRRSMPLVPEVEGSATVSGHVYVSPGEPYRLADEPLGASWPRQVQAVQVEKMAQVVGGDLFSYPVRIDAESPGALTVDWQVINVSPAKHHGYAVQWFSMAAMLALIYFLRSCNLWQLIRGTASSQAENE